MSTSTHPIIVLSDSNVDDAFSSTDYTLASPDYSPATPGNTSFDFKTESDPSEDPSVDYSVPLAITPFPDDLYMQIKQAYYATNEESSDHHPHLLFHTTCTIFSSISTLEVLIEDIHVPYRSDMKSLLDDIDHMILPKPLRDTEPPAGSPIPSSPSSSPVRSTIPPSDYPFDESIFTELDNSLWIIPRPLGVNQMALKRKSISAAPAMTQAAIRKLVADSVAVALEAQAVTMENADNTNRNTEESETHVARKCSYKEFMSYKPSYIKGTEGAVGLIRWFERTELVFLLNNCTKDSKMKFATGTLTEDALSWWNSFSQPIGIEEAYKITCLN
nr:reverse transcriptase domain-containing protein [Tanacetum cinerariifolium]